MSNFFKHDDVIKAMRVMHPSLVHGVDFIALMGINEDGSPASDAWIERWNSTTIDQPTIADLKAAVAGMDMAALPMFAPPPPITSITSLQFIERFTPTEQSNIATAAMSNAALFLWFTKLAAAQSVVFADPRLSAGMDALVAAGLMSQARSEEILPPAVRAP